MHGLSPRNNSLTTKQISVSAEISAAIPDMPITVSELISEMATPDFSLADQTLELNDNGAVIESFRNRQIISAIELALTSPSSECDPKIKAQIFLNASASYHFDHTAIPYLTQIVQGLQDKGQQINLDDVVLCHFNSQVFGGNFNLSGMSAQRAEFSSATLYRVDMSNADLSGATFISSNLGSADLRRANITGAVFRAVDFFATKVCELTGNQSAIQKRAFANTESSEAGDHTLNTTRHFLEDQRIDADPDTEPFTLPAQTTSVTGTW